MPFLPPYKVSSPALCHSRLGFIFLPVRLPACLLPYALLIHSSYTSSYTAIPSLPYSHTTSAPSFHPTFPHSLLPTFLSLLAYRMSRTSPNFASRLNLCTAPASRPAHDNNMRIKSSESPLYPRDWRFQEYFSITEWRRPVTQGLRINSQSPPFFFTYFLLP